jgi:hypothetical protein
VDKSLLSFICVEPKEDGDLAVVFRCLSKGTQGAVIELSSEQIQKRIADYKGAEGLITNFDKLPQVIEFQKALKELERKTA